MEDMQGTLLGLFTEVAIIEHLVRVREDRLASGEMTTGQFGVLNYFILNHPTPDSISGIAWCFQEDEEYTRGKILALAELGLVSVTPTNGSNFEAMVMITDFGRAKHAHVVNKMGPDIEAVVAEIAAEDIQTTFKTLREIRLTLDNLPDR